MICQAKYDKGEYSKLLFPQPTGQFFQIHGNKPKLHPVSYLGQASVLGTAHDVFFFSVGKDPFNGFLPPLI